LPGRIGGMTSAPTESANHQLIVGCIASAPSFAACTGASDAVRQ
jgi:hypothetical protein